MATFNWDQYYKSFEDTREAEKEQRQRDDMSARRQVNTLAGDVEREVMADAERGRDAKREDLDVTKADSFNRAKEAFERQQAQNVPVAKSQWESGLNLGRQEGESVNPWDTLGKRLVGVQQNVNRVSQQTRQRQRQEAIQQAQDDFNRRSREIMANDQKYNNSSADFNAAIDRYAEQARQQQKMGRSVVTSPYAQAMQDCKDGVGPCPPSEVNSYLQAAQDPNNPSNNPALTAEQQRLIKRLQDIQEDEGFSYGTGTDETGWF